VKKYREKVDAILNSVAGNTTEALDGENVRIRETNFGDLIAEIIRSVAKADASIINGGGIRASVPKGPIYIKSIYTAIPFDNYIVAIRLTGGQIREALEHGVAGVENGAGSFPQVSGISFAYSPLASPGARVREVRIGGKPLDPAKEYMVATNDFLAAGGDGYAFFGDAIKASKDFAVVGGILKGEKLVFSDSGHWLRDLVIDYLREKKTITPLTDNQIKELR
jgi:2',3'-cyclic-nucleotide 2'-phosphodiesterase (5'-nucleotidase family)